MPATVRQGLLLEAESSQLSRNPGSPVEETEHASQPSWEEGKTNSLGSVHPGLQVVNVSHLSCAAKGQPRARMQTAPPAPNTAEMAVMGLTDVGPSTWPECQQSHPPNNNMRLLWLRHRCSWGPGRNIE